MVVAVNANILKDPFVVELDYLVRVRPHSLQPGTQGGVFGLEKSDALVGMFTRDPFRSPFR